MCLFTCSTDPIDLFWLGEAILVCPDGPMSERDVEVQVNGLVRAQNKKGGVLTFVHRGEIYDLQDISGEWCEQDDWYAESW